MRILFPFLITKNINRFLLLTRARSFYSPLRRGYIGKVSVYLAHKYFVHDCSTDSISFSRRKK